VDAKLKKLIAAAKQVRAAKGEAFASKQHFEAETRDRHAQAGLTDK